MQIAFTSIVYPSLLLAYMGQAAYLSKHHGIENEYHIGFYVSVPGADYFEPVLPKPHGQLLKMALNAYSLIFSRQRS